MKRILTAFVFAVGVSVLFTGCNSIILSVGEDDYIEIPYEAMENWDDMPDYYEENETDKYSDLTGKQAFKLKDGHSSDASDIADFQIGTLLEDGTFIYAYSTKESGEGDQRNNVHCAAAYNYKTGAMKVFHENVYKSNVIDTADEDYLMDETEEGESFYIQICDESSPESSDIFIYDNGMGYIYSSSGTLKFQTEIESFIREHFDKAFSVEISNAITDGNNKIYLELIIEKNEIKIEEGSSEEISEEEADKEAEELEEQIEDDTIEMIVLYEFKEIESTIDQTLENVDIQGRAWQAMGMAYGACTTEPDVQTDWAKVQEIYPDQWSQFFLDDFEEKPKVYQWKNEPVFQTSNDGYVCTFVPDTAKKDQVSSFNYIDDNSDLMNCFILYEDKYYEIYGKVNTFKNWSFKDKTFTRNYLYQWTETETNSEGVEIEVIKQEIRTQSITVPTWRYASIDGEYLEGYIADEYITQIVGSVDGNVMVVSENALIWITKDMDSEFVSFVLDEFILDVGSDSDTVYVVESYLDKTMIIESNVSEINQNNGLGVDIIASHQIEGSRISGAVSENSFIDFSVDQKYFEDYETEFGELNSMEQITADKIIKSSIALDQTLLHELESYDISVGAETASGKGYLLTTFNNGLLFYDVGSRYAFCLDDGTWYRTWKQGNQYISVGFSDSDASYGTLDVAFARVYEYDLNSLYQDSMNAILAAAKTAYQQRAEKSEELTD